MFIAVFINACFGASSVQSTPHIYLLLYWMLAVVIGLTDREENILKGKFWP